MAESIRRDPQSCIVKRPFFCTSACLAILGMAAIFITILFVLGFMCTPCTEIERKSRNNTYCCDVLYDAEDAAREEVLYNQNLRPTTKGPMEELKFIKLCLHENEVVDCDKDKSAYYACLGDKDLRNCESFEDHENNSMCAYLSSRHVFLCGNFSHNNRLCHLEGNQTTHIGLCGKSKEFVCLSESGYLEKCSNLTEQIPTINPSQFSGTEKLYQVNSILTGKQYPVEEGTDSLSTFQNLTTRTNHDVSPTLSTTQEPVISSTTKNKPATMSLDRSSILSILVNSTPNLNALENWSSLSKVFGEETSVDQKRNLINEIGCIKIINGKQINCNDTDSPTSLADRVLYKRRSKMVIEGKFTPLCTKTDKTLANFLECTVDTITNTVCIGILSGKMMMCKENNLTDIPITVCTEKSTRKVITCEASQKLYFCFSGDSDKPIFKPCSNKGRQVCMDENGSLKPCLESSSTEEAIATVMTSEGHLEEHTQELCRGEHFPDILYQCPEINGSKACMEVKSGKIEDCVKFVDANLTVQICMEESSRKILTCEEHPRRGLCFAKSESSGLIKLCNQKDRPICLDREGRFQICSKLPVNISEVQDPTGAQFDIHYEPFEKRKEWLNFWQEWTSQGDKVIENEDQETVELCMRPDEGFHMSECNDKYIHWTACLSVTIDVISQCKYFEDSDLAIPLCIEKNSRGILTCGAYPKARLCFPRSENTSSIKPCNQQDRQICLDSENRLQKCSQLPAHFNISEGVKFDIHYKPFENRTEWLNFWLEWNSEDGNVVGNEDQRVVELCVGQEELPIQECKDNETEWNVCLSVTLGTVNQCKYLEDSDMAIPLCKEVTSHRIVTCSNFTQAPLCIPKDNFTKSRMVPCPDKKRELCLNKGGKIDSCVHVPTFPTKVEQNRDKIIIHAEVQKDVKKGADQLERKHVCIVDDSEKLEQCVGDESNSVACIHAKNFTLATCSKIEKEYEIGIPVCFQERSSELVTCGKFNNENVCYLSEISNQTRLQHCSSKSRMVCMTKMGTLKKCSEIFRGYLEEGYNEHQINPDFGKRNKRDASTQPQILDSLCIESKSKLVVPCTDDKEMDFLCLRISNGKLAACNKINPGEMRVPLCTERASTELYTCEKFSKVNVCTLDDGGFLGTCRSKNNFACLKNGRGETCLNMLNSTAEVSVAQSTYSTYKYPEEYNRSWEDQNTEKVYEAENAIRSSIMKGVTLLCKNDLQKILTCDEDSGLEFLCLGITEGKIEACDKFKTEEYVMPVCMEAETRRFMVCGKFYKEYLCIYKRSTGGYLKTCFTPNDQTCITETGTLSKCTHVDYKYPMLFPTGAKNFGRKNLYGEDGNNGNETVESDGSISLENDDEDIITESNENGIMENDDEDNDEDVRKEDNEMKQIVNNVKTMVDVDGEDVENNEDEIPENDDEKTEDDEEEDENNDGNTEDDEEQVENNEELSEKDTESIENGEVQIDERDELENDESLEDENDESVQDENEGGVEDENEEAVKNENESSSEDENEKAANNEGAVEDKNESSSEDKTDENVKGNSIESYVIRSNRNRRSVLVADFPKQSKRLCNHEQGKSVQDVIDCNKVQNIEFACIGVTSGRIQKCNLFNQSEPALAVCLQGETNFLVTCDIFSNIRLCFGDNGDLPIRPCSGNLNFVCLTQDGKPAACGDAYNQRHHPVRRDASEQTSDEKFLRFHCSDCSIESQLVVIGTPDDILPEIEVITFAPNE